MLKPAASRREGISSTAPSLARSAGEGVTLEMCKYLYPESEGNMLKFQLQSIIEPFHGPER